MNKYKYAFITLFYLFSLPALAYIDPGEGNQWFQTAMGIILGIIVTLKIFWPSIKKYWSRQHKKQIDLE